MRGEKRPELDFGLIAEDVLKLFTAVSGMKNDRVSGREFGFVKDLSSTCYILRVVSCIPLDKA
jgi:hypothetical protein